jgi:hypothetical protein
MYKRIFKKKGKIMIVFNEENQDIISEKHVCYFTEQDGKNICLREVIEKTLTHPSAPEDAYIQKYDVKTVCKVDRRSFKAHSLVLLEAVQNVNKEIYNED